MRKCYNKFMLALAIMVLFCLCSNTALAETNNDEELSADIKIESTVGDNTKVNVSVTVKNTSMGTLKNINTKGSIPEGLELVDGNIAQKQIDSLEPDTSKTLEYSVKIAGNSDNGSNKGGSSDSLDKDESSELDSKSEGKNKKAETGDNKNLILYLIVACIALTVLIATCLRNKKTKGMLSLILCFSMIISLLIQVKPVKAANSEHKSFSVSDEYSIGGKDYLFKAEISYDKLVPVEPSGGAVSRAEWIADLMKTMGYDGHTIDYDKNLLPYTDIEDHENANEILIAYANSILPEEAAKFRPNDTASREFAAVTAVRALGFEPLKDIDCDDATDITYKQDVETAVAMNIMQLYGNKFYPHRELLRSEADDALNGVQVVLDSESIDEHYDSKILYFDDVVMVPDDVRYEVNKNTIIFTPTSSVPNFEKDMIFILPDHTPYKVVSADMEGNTCIVNTSIPEIEKTVDCIDVQGYGTIDMTKFIPAEGVSIEMTETPALKEREKLMDVEGILGAPGEIEFTLHKKVGKGEFFGKLSTTLRKVMYKADVDITSDGYDVRNVYLKTPFEMKIDGGYKIETEDHSIGTPIEPKGGIIELGKVPVVGIPGVTVYIQVGLKYNIEGQLHIVYALDGAVGVQVLNNRLRAVKDLNSTLEIPQLEATAKIGPQIAGLLEVCEQWDLIDFNLSAGAAWNGNVIVRNPFLVCLDTNIYMYGELSALDEGVIGDWLDIGYTYTFWNEKNSPFKHRWHFENLQPVDACTYKDDNLKNPFSDFAFQYKEYGSVHSMNSNIKLNQDGTFTCVREYLDMGDIGDGYPGGTCYTSEFEGTFSAVIQVDEYTHRLKIESVEQSNQVGNEYIKDNVRYIIQEDSQFCQLRECYIYLPGTPFQIQDGCWVSLEEKDLFYIGPYYDDLRELLKNRYVLWCGKDMPVFLSEPIELKPETETS